MEKGKPIMHTRKQNDISFVITDHNTNNTITISPKAVESCMNPGTFHITPVQIEEDGGILRFIVGEDSLEIHQKDLQNNRYTIKEIPFTPEIIRNIHSCDPCTNCGRCSW